MSCDLFAPKSRGQVTLIGPRRVDSPPVSSPITSATPTDIEVLLAGLKNRAPRDGGTVIAGQSKSEYFQGKVCSQTRDLQ